MPLPAAVIGDVIAVKGQVAPGQHRPTRLITQFTFGPCHHHQRHTSDDSRCSDRQGINTDQFAAVIYLSLG